MRCQYVWSPEAGKLRAMSQRQEQPDELEARAQLLDERAPNWMAGPEDEIAALVIQLAAQLVSHMRSLVGQEGVTEPQAMLVRQLRQPLPMKRVAELMHCDASNLTGIVDRLESKGLLERRTLAADRRIKELVLTSEGEGLQRRLDELSTSAPGLSELSTQEQETLIALLRRSLESLREADRGQAAPAGDATS
jgi:DNA-binding MarR family transcriptional regulator